MQSRVRLPSEDRRGMGFPLTDGEDISVLLEPCWGKLEGPFHRLGERTGAHTSPPQGPLLLDFAWLPDAAIAFFRLTLHWQL